MTCGRDYSALCNLKYALEVSEYSLNEWLIVVFVVGFVLFSEFRC